MSRIGKKVINIPAGTKVDVKDNVVTATGKLGTLSYTVPADIAINIENGVMTLSIDQAKKKQLNAIHGTTRANVFNIIEGVTNGFNKNLEINGLGYRASVAGNKLTLEVGFSHPVVMDVPAGVTVAADPKSNLIEIKGSDKFVIGDFAAKIRRIRPPEPYKGSGIKYQGEHIARKAGKTAAGGK